VTRDICIDDYAQMKHVEEQIVEEIVRLKALVPDSEILNHLATFHP
jgi:hypothetical protein